MLKIFSVKARNIKEARLFPVILAALMWCNGYVRSNAQIPLYNKFEHFTTESGLPQNSITGIVQDKDGFLWISTFDGLVRFDGKNFTLFNSYGKGKTSTSRILDIFADNQNNIWILNFNQIIDKLNPETFEVTRNYLPVDSIRANKFLLTIDTNRSDRIIHDSEGKHWMLWDGRNYFLFDASDKKLKNLFAGNIKKSTPFIYAFFEDLRGRLWLLTTRGLEVSDTNWENFKQIDAPANFDLAEGVDFTWPFIELPGDRILFAHVDRLFIYYEKENSFEEIELPDVPVLVPSNIQKFFLDQEGRPVFEHLGYIFRLEDDGSITTLWKYLKNDKAIVNNYYLDRSNTLWVAGDDDGLYKLDLNTPAFESHEYKYNMLTDILEAELGISEKDIPGHWKKFGLSYALRWCYYNDGLVVTQEDYSYGQEGKIFVVKDGTIQPLNLGTPPHFYIVGIKRFNNQLYAIDQGGNLYSWTRLGAAPVKQNVINVKLKTSGGIVYPDSESENLKGLVSDDSYLWVLSAMNRLYQIKNNSVINRYAVLKDNFILTDIYQMTHFPDVLWIGSLGGGLIQWDKENNSVRHVFTVEDGLPNNNITGLVEDDHGYLWISSFNGISRFDLAENSFTNYTTKDGLIESEFNRHHILGLPDGRIAMGTTRGYNIFNPHEFQSDDFQPDISIVSLQINDRIIKYPEDSVLLKKGLNKLSQISLKYDQNSLQIETAAMQYNNPSANKYRYKLEHFNKDWIDLGDQRIIRFDNLPPGNYTLEMNASNTSGRWSDRIHTIMINISPPPWLSWWAYVVYISAAGVLIFLYWRSYKARLVRKQEELFNKREAERLKEVNEMKTRFFSNITHEFRTPLTMIISPIEKYFQGNSTKEKADALLNANYRHGKNLLKLVNQLLDISKIESRKMSTNLARGDLAMFTSQIVDEFKEGANQKEINLRFENKNISYNYYFDEHHWERILSNLLSNAIKFTPEKGEIIASLEEEVDTNKNWVSLRVKDSGIGIPKMERGKLFDRFYQVDNSATRQFEGTGIGLALVKETVELLEGSVSVESEEGKGSEFIVKVPLIIAESFDGESGKQVVARVNEFQSKNENENENDPLILVADDNSELRSFILESLAEKWNVLGAENGRKAWEMIKENLPDIVISDIMMPEMDGYELCEMTNKNPLTSHISFILLTAKASQDSIETGIKLGADEYLTKPFHLNELELRIQNILVKRRAIRDFFKKELLSEDPKVKPLKVEDIFLSSLYNYLDEHLQQSDLSVDTVSADFGMSKSTLNRKLKALLDTSTNEIIKQYRLQKSLEFISAGYNIADVAFKVGFESPSYFAQCFRERYHQSPSEFQKKAV